MSVFRIAGRIPLVKNKAGGLHGHQVHSTVTALRTPVYNSAPKRTCSEAHPSLKSGENTDHKHYLISECTWDY